MADSNRWTDEKCIAEAQREPGRIKFWLRWHPDYAEACRSVCENPPSFDRLQEQTFPDPEDYRRERAEFEARQAVRRGEKDA